MYNMTSKNIVFEKLSLVALEAISKFNEVQEVVFNMVKKAVVPSVTSTNLQEHDTISDEEISPRQLQFHQRYFFSDDLIGRGKTFVIS